MCSLFAAFASECDHVARTFCQMLRTPVLATCPGMQPTALSHANTQRTTLTRSCETTLARRLPYLPHSIIDMSEWDTLSKTPSKEALPSDD